MAEKKTKKLTISGIIVIGLVITGIYLIWMPSDKGILVSCDNRQIIDIRDTSPPLQEIVQAEFCRVNITVTDLNDNLICQDYMGISAIERGIVTCKGLKEMKGTEVKINATFFDLNNNLIGQDSKQLLVNP